MFAPVNLFAATGVGEESDTLLTLTKADALNIVFVEHGILFVRSGKAWVHSAAQLIIGPRTAWRDLRFHTTWQITAVSIPFAALERVFQPSMTSTEIFSTRTAIEHCTQALTQSAVGADANVSQAEERSIGQAIFDLASGILQHRVNVFERGGSPHDVLREQALEIISRKCNDVT